MIINGRNKKTAQKNRDRFIFFANTLSQLSPFALTASHFLLFAQEKVTKEKGTPTSGSGGCAARLPSFRCRSGGRRTRGVHAPLRLSPHPCGSSPCATPPLGLLTGTRAPSCLVVFLCAARIDRSHALRGNAAFGALRPPYVLCCWRLCDAERGDRTQNLQAAPNAPSGG